MQSCRTHAPKHTYPKTSQSMEPLWIRPYPQRGNEQQARGVKSGRSGKAETERADGAWVNPPHRAEYARAASAGQCPVT